ncbi:hypothetical protein HY501_00480 [Candidatus Woesearchaeota archaeon]|nr:hypothetical protein [Candidatus Woesearchaeota archaeon]
MNPQEIIAYYSRKEVQDAILAVAQDREIAVKYQQGHFGKRPDILQYPGDVKELAKKGATSFHISCERWNDPLVLQPGMVKKQLDIYRKGWDLLIDIDTVFWDFAKYTAYLIVEALKFHGVKGFSVKFSGGKGFHIVVPFEAFPDEVNGTSTKDLYPESLRVIASYLGMVIEERLRDYILNKSGLSELAEKSGKSIEQMCKGQVFNPFSIVELDSVLIANRHLFRSPYSLHEKTWLASIPIPPEKILAFDKEMAKPERVRIGIPFLEREVAANGSELIIQAFDWYTKKAPILREEPEKKEKQYEEITGQVGEELFPPCIKKILEGKMTDGKKRSLFILVNFLKCLGWGPEQVKQKILEWNKSNSEPLRENYVISQIQWHERQKEKKPAPNCLNPAYYKDLRVCVPDNFCQRIKNPVNYSLLKHRSKVKATSKPGQARK